MTKGLASTASTISTCSTPPKGALDPVVGWDLARPSAAELEAFGCDGFLEACRSTGGFA
jgi:hypothetical protein